jgi:hypothetical protein
MKNNKLYQSHSDAKFKTHSKLAQNAIKKPQMMIVEENISKAKSRMELVGKKRNKVLMTSDEDTKLVLLTEESNILHRELKVRIDY